jgi:hypothetical protein
VTASFQGKNRFFLGDLGPEEVRVYENGKPRKIEYFAGKEVPVAFGLLIDRNILPRPFDEPRREGNQVPASMAAGNVAFQILDQALGGQTGWLGVYDQEMSIAADFTADSGRIKDAMQMLRGPERIADESFLYGALVQAVQKLSDRNEKRRVLILLINVLDTATSSKLKNLKNLLSVSNVELFIAGFAPRSSINAGPGLPPAISEASLRDLGGVTAGTAYFSFMEGIEGLGRRISNQIRTFYTIGFESDSPSDKPSSLKIECTRPGTKVTAHPIIPRMQ